MTTCDNDIKTFSEYVYMYSILYIASLHLKYVLITAQYPDKQYAITIVV